MSAPKLIDHLDELARSTWHKVNVGPARGSRFDERSITDHNLFELDRAGHRSISVFKTGADDEASNGSDFELWLGSDQDGWIGVRAQAKIVKDMAYEQLGHEVQGKRQYDVLLERAGRDGMWPVYCMYNGWDGPWPDDVRNRCCERNLRPSDPAQPCGHVELEQFGCSLVSAPFVKARHTGRPNKGRLAIDDYLAASFPWSWIWDSNGSDEGDPGVGRNARGAPPRYWPAQLRLSRRSSRQPGHPGPSMIRRKTKNGPESPTRRHTWGPRSISPCRRGLLSFVSHHNPEQCQWAPQLLWRSWICDARWRPACSDRPLTSIRARGYLADCGHDGSSSTKLCDRRGVDDQDRRAVVGVLRRLADALDQTTSELACDAVSAGLSVDAIATHTALTEREVRALLIRRS